MKQIDIYYSVQHSIIDSVWRTLRASVHDSVIDSVWDSLRASVYHSVYRSVYRLVSDSLKKDILDETN